MSKFEIMVTLSKSLFKSELRKEVIYYSRNNIDYSDNIIFHNKTISLSGSRTKHMDSTNILETVNSSFYSCLTKALLFAYFERGCFKVKSITVCIDEDDSNIKKYEEKEIKQVFIKEKLVEVNSIKLFSNKDISDTMMNSLMNLTLSFNEKDLRFDYTWKCFNSLIRDIFKEKKDFNMLKKLREDLELNPGLYPNILSFSKNIDFNYLNQCFLKAMICNNFPKGNTQGLVSFFKDFKDIRVITTLKKVMNCKKNDLNSIQEYNNIDSYFNSEIKSNTVKDTDIVRLIILKYAYYLRCKYFHAEKLPANFLINNANYNELLRISEPLSIICKDLLEIKL